MGKNTVCFSKTFLLVQYSLFYLLFSSHSTHLSNTAVNKNVLSYLVMYLSDSEWKQSKIVS